MAPTIHQESGLREVTLPAVSPEGLSSPLDYALPRTARLHGKRVDWAELGTVGLMVSSAMLFVYRLFWATQF